MLNFVATLLGNLLVGVLGVSIMRCDSFGDDPLVELIIFDNMYHDKILGKDWHSTYHSILDFHVKTVTSSC